MSCKASGRVDEQMLRMSLQKHKSEWDHNLATIDSLLDSSGNVYSVLSVGQRAGLNRMRDMMINPQHQKKESHIPKDLFHMSKSENGEVCDFIISHFGGVTSKKRSLKKFVKATIVARSFINRLAENGKRRSSIHQNVPNEFLDMKREKQLRVREILSWENLSRWDFDVFELDELTNGNPLLFVGWALLESPGAQRAMSQVLKISVPNDTLEGYDFQDAADIPCVKLWAFLRDIEAQYSKETQYHNNIHAADVTQTLHSILQMDNIASQLPRIKIVATLLAAICHDVQHPGVNNSYLINSRSDMAVLYNDTSVLENMHAAKAFEKLIGTNCDPEVDIFKQMNRAQVDSIRTVMVYAIIHTDMTKHFSSVNRIRAMIAKYESAATANLNSDEENFFLAFLLHMADISNAAKPGKLCIDWAHRCLEEFFAQGDKEKSQNLPVSPLCDRVTTSRPKSQIGFIEFVIHPAYEALGIMLPQIKKEVLPIVSNNLSYWKGQANESKSDHTIDSKDSK
jgi:hypothetical protein